MFMSHNEWILGRMVGVRLLKFLRILLSCKIYAFGIILIHPVPRSGVLGPPLGQKSCRSCHDSRILPKQPNMWHPGIATECTVGDFVTTCL